MIASSHLSGLTAPVPPQCSSNPCINLGRIAIVWECRLGPHAIEAFGLRSVSPFTADFHCTILDRLRQVCRNLMSDAQAAPRPPTCLDNETLDVRRGVAGPL